MVVRQRLDALLVQRGLCSSREKAKAAVRAGEVKVDGKVLSKPAHSILENAALDVATAPQPFVSRAGAKLSAALDLFGVEAHGCTALDVGASTGGFTDVLLRAGARSVCCVDVGHYQLAPQLRADERVTSIEGVNARSLVPNDARLPAESFDLVVVDLSFISLRLVLPSLWPLLARSERARLVALVKPQFEVGRAHVGRGVVRDEAARRRALAEVVEFAKASLPDCAVLGSMDSPVPGTDGNREFLVALAASSLQSGAAAGRARAHGAPLCGATGGDSGDGAGTRTAASSGSDPAASTTVAIHAAPRRQTSAARAAAHARRKEDRARARRPGPADRAADAP